MKATVNGITLGYEDKGTGPAVILLKEAASGGREEQIANLVRYGYRVVLPAPTAKSAAPMADEVVALMNYLGVGRAVFAGGICGADVLSELTKRYRRRVRAAVLLAEPQTGGAERWADGGEREVLKGLDGLPDYLDALAGYRRKPEWRYVA